MSSPPIAFPAGSHPPPRPAAQPSSRYRHPGDVIRLISAGLLLAGAFAASAAAFRWLLGPAASVPGGLGTVGQVITGLVQVACLAAVVVVVAATLRRRRFRLLAGLAAGAVAAAGLTAGMLALLGAERPAMLTANQARGSWLASTAFPAPALLAVAVVVAAAPWLSRPWRRAAWLALRLPFWPTVLTQGASSFINRVSPANVGGMALNVRYLQKTGMEPSAGVAAVGVNALAGAIVHVILLVIFLSWAGRGAGQAFKLPSGSKLLLILAILAAVVGLILVTRQGRKFAVRKVLPSLRSSLLRSGRVRRTRLPPGHLLAARAARLVLLAPATAHGLPIGAPAPGTWPSQGPSGRMDGCIPASGGVRAASVVARREGGVPCRPAGSMCPGRNARRWRQGPRGTR